MPDETATAPLGVLLISGQHEYAHYAFMVAAAAAAMGRRVVILASNEGLHALMDDWSALGDSGRDAAVRLRGVAGLGELRESAIELKVRLMACDSGLRLAAIDPASLTAGVEVVGIPAFLEAVRGGQIVTL